MFCNFIQKDIGIYECIICGTVIETQDNSEPTWPCSGFLLSQSQDKSLLPDSKILERFSICQACEFFRNNSCSQCGCIVTRQKNYFNKLSIATEKCPIDKW